VENETSAAREFAVIMAYEAFRICLGLPTRTHSPRDVMRWMQLMMPREPIIMYTPRWAPAKDAKGAPHG